MNNYEFWNDLDKIFEAIVAYQEKTIEFNKQFINPWVNLGNVFNKNESDGAIAAHKNAIEIDPKNAQNWYGLANVYTRSGDFDNAIQAYQKAIELGFESGELYKNIGIAYAMTARHKESIPVFQKALELSEDEKEKAMIWNHLGNVFRKLNDYVNAFKAFQQADQLESVAKTKLEDQTTEVTDDEMPDSSSSAEEGPYASPMTDEADPVIESVSAPEDEGDDTFVEDLELAIDQGNDLVNVEYEATYQSPTRDEEETLEDENENSDDFDNDMPVIFESDFTGKTLEDFLEDESPDASDFSVENQPISDRLSTEEKRKDGPFPEDKKFAEDFEVSVKEKVSEPTPENNNRIAFSAYDEYLQDNNISNKYTRTEGQLEENRAVNTVSEEVRETKSKAKMAGVSTDLTLDSETKNAHVWNELGNVYFNAGSFDDAITAYCKAIELDRQFPWPYTNLGMAYVQKERFEEAILLFQRSIELFSNEKDKAVSWNHLGNLYRRLEDYEKAIAAYQRADDIDPGNITVTSYSSLSLLGSEERYQGVGSTF